MASGLGGNLCLLNSFEVFVQLGFHMSVFVM